MAWGGEKGGGNEEKWRKRDDGGGGGRGKAMRIERVYLLQWAHMNCQMVCLCVHEQNASTNLCEWLTQLVFFYDVRTCPLLPTPFLSTRNTTNILVEWLGKCQVDWCVIRYWHYRLAFRLITWLAFWAALTHKTCVYEVSDVAAWYSVWRTRLVIYYTWRWRLFQRRLLCSYRCWFMNMNIVEWRWFFLRRRVLI